MAIHNKSHSNHALMSLNKQRKECNMKQKKAKKILRNLINQKF